MNIFSKNCKNCNKTYIKVPANSKLYWSKKMFCSHSCSAKFNKEFVRQKLLGIPRPTTVLEKMRLTQFKKGQIAYNKGTISQKVIKAREIIDKRKIVRCLIKNLKKRIKKLERDAKPPRTHSIEWKKMMSERMKGKNNPYFGVKHTEEIKQKMKGENNGNWNGGVSEEHHLIRESYDYKFWRTSVFKRDSWTCKECNLKGGWNKELKKRINIQADHIKPFALYPDLRFALSNGRTLCEDCHRKTDTWGVNRIYLEARMFK